MIRIERDVFYSRADLAAMLEAAGVNVDTFLARIKPRRILRALYRGSDLLTGWDHAKELSEPVSLPPAGNAGNKKRSTKPRGDRGNGKLIGGVFTRKELGLDHETEKTA